LSSWRGRQERLELKALLSDWPGDGPRTWLELVNRPMAVRKVEAVRTSIVRNRAFASPAWQAATTAGLGLTHTLRPEGRPKAEVEWG
jgi:putative transposase